MLRECTVDDLIPLQQMSISTYFDTFAHLNTPSNMSAYLEKSFALDQLRSELENTNSKFYFIYFEEQLAGYCKINESDAQTDLFDPESLELERIYVKKEFQGCGLGRVLMDHAIEIARAKAKVYLWLGVWEKNEKTLLFYQKNGFYKIGTHSFFMGEEEQTDFIMRKDL